MSEEVKDTSSSNATVKPKEEVNPLTDEQLLMANLGIKETQLNTDVKTTTVKIDTPPNQELMRVVAKDSIKAINVKYGKKISFATLVRDKYQLDANGNQVKVDGKKVPRYKLKKFEGFYTVDKIKRFNKSLNKSITLYKVSKMIQYVQDYDVASFTDLDN